MPIKPLFDCNLFNNYVQIVQATEYHTRSPTKASWRLICENEQLQRKWSEHLIFDCMRLIIWRVTPWTESTQTVRWQTLICHYLPFKKQSWNVKRAWKVANHTPSDWRGTVLRLQVNNRGRRLIRNWICSTGNKLKWTSLGEQHSSKLKRIQYKKTTTAIQ